MAEIEFVKPERWMLESIANDMRPADILEIWVARKVTPLEALVDGWAKSHYSTVAMCDGEPLVMYGLVKGDILSGHGVVWMLGANSSLKYKRQFFIQTPPVIEQMLNICSKLYNMVHSKHTESIRWLEWLGFTIEDPQPHGPYNELFHKFHIGGS